MDGLPEVFKNTNNNLITSSGISLWLERWFLSSNAKDIGTLYLIFALLAGLVGTAFSVLIRLELSGPGVQFIADNQLYNSIITAHAIVMIFFMVKTNAGVLNERLTLFSTSLSRCGSTIRIGEGYDLKKGNDNKDFKPKGNYVKVLIEDPYNNRDIILKVTKRQKGIYVWETLDGKNMYVGHSINLYNRISYYFLPSILKTKARRVLKYLNKHGFSDIKLTIYITDLKSTLDQVVSLEQQFIDNIRPNLNVDLVASSFGYHEPMSQEIRHKLRKQRGSPIYIYDSESLNLLYIFESKQHMYDSINIHQKTLNDSLHLATLYVNYFFLSLDLIEESSTNLVTLDEIKTLVIDKRGLHAIKHPAAKGILAEFKNDTSKNLEFDSLNSLAKHLKGDRQVIRDYLKGKKSGYYRGKWRFTYKNI